MYCVQQTSLEGRGGKGGSGEWGAEAKDELVAKSQGLHRRMKGKPEKMHIFHRRIVIVPERLGYTVEISTE